MSATNKNFPGLLSGNQLKLIALVTMTCDHVGSQLLPVGVHFARGRAAKLAAAAAALILLSLTMGGIQWHSLFALILLFLYSGQRGARPLKNFFYVYYPLHLAAIYLISLVS